MKSILAGLSISAGALFSSVALGAVYTNGATSFTIPDGNVCNDPITYKTKLGNQNYTGSYFQHFKSTCGAFNGLVEGEFQDSSATEGCSGALRLQMSNNVLSATWTVQGNAFNLPCTGIGKSFTVSNLRTQSSGGGGGSNSGGSAWSLNNIRNATQWEVIDASGVNCRVGAGTNHPVDLWLQAGSVVYTDTTFGPNPYAFDAQNFPWVRVVGMSNSSCFIKADRSLIYPIQ